MKIVLFLRMYVTSSQFIMSGVPPFSAPAFWLARRRAKNQGTSIARMPECCSGCGNISPTRCQGPSPSRVIGSRGLRLLQSSLSRHSPA